MIRGLWIVCGGRYYRDEERIYQILDAARERLGLSYLVEGGCETGADKIARQWRDARRVPGESYQAAWSDIYRPGAVVRDRSNGTRYDAMAGPIRNQRMLDEAQPEGVIAFRGGAGTLDLVKRAERADIRVIRVDWVED